MANELKPIRTKADYKNALDVLATLIDAYEARHYPMDRHEQLGISAEVLIRPTRADEAA